MTLNQLLKVKIWLFIIFNCTAIYGQRSPKVNETFISGYQEKVTGNELQYPSGIEGLTSTLISRVDAGNQKMEWSTAPVSLKNKDGEVTFVHYVGYYANRPGSVFNFYVDGEKQTEIALPGLEKTSWTLALKNDQKLSFEKVHEDNNHGYFGYLYYTVPAKNLKPGTSLKLGLTGNNEESQTYFMVFKRDLSESIKVTALPALIRSAENKKYQTLLTEIISFREPVKAQLSIDGKLDRIIDLEPGIQTLKISYPEVYKEKTITLKLDAGKEPMITKIRLKPVKKWKVNFVQHSHTDIGYTRSQTEILAEHPRYIDYALDYCDATDDYPEESKFRWTCEASWAVDEFLNSRSQTQIDRLKQRIKEGRIEVTGMYFNFNELPDEQSLAASLAPIKNISDKGIKITSAMQNDVNGIAWCMNDYFNSLDIKYLTMGTHGHKALISFDTPLAFWWVSPSGNKMLTFRAEHYMQGNTFGVHTDNFEDFEKGLLNYLIKLDERGYPYDITAIQHSGFMTDNSPPSIKSSGLIKKWNEKYEWPKIKTAIASDFFEEFENKNGKELIEVKAHWPDWWTDGFASGAREVAATRNAHVDLIAGQGGLAMAKLLGSKMPKGIKGRVFEANKALLFYGEHTFGAQESVSQPYSKATMEQREIKESYAWEASRRASMIGEEAIGLLSEYMGKTKNPSLAVFNTLNWEREGLVEIFIDHQQVVPGSKIRLVDEQGKKYPVQVLKPWHGGTYWGAWVENIPAFGYKKFDIEVYKEQHSHSHGDEMHRHGEQEKNLNYQEKQDHILLDNPWYSIKIDKLKGTISQIYDKDLAKNIIDEKSEYSLGEFILEKIGGRAQLFTNRTANGESNGPLTDYTRQPLDSVWLSEIREGEIWNTIKFRGKTETAYDHSDAFSLELKVYNTTKRIDFDFELKKKPITNPESFYISFPFELEKGKIHFEISGGPMEAGVDQVPGSANDWNTVQNFVQIKNDKEQIVLVSPEAPIMQFGAINTGRFEYKGVPQSNNLYSWPMNNYWTTNFNADQRGMYTWTYQLTSMDKNSDKEATKFGWGSRVPFLARVIPASVLEKKATNTLSILSNIPDNILIVNATPLEDENGIILHLREVSGKESSFIPEIFSGKTIKYFETNVIGDEIKETSKLNMKALESKFFKLSWE
ncbi:glycoside hydrolase family 38 N-terminal domain-containing protein [Arenibacter troitsensis]|uniref:Glycosyl hydrolases family 38 C-terminal domain-containing protein n=1 Tax=Arenibacter troitsensis TaxID=188872 RepID=A0A1X7KKY8_9FLAO|nr:glycoside hydrolase family 38 C-terminal domain-containing protein [Arenibacter troitsensis]SMG41323.1 Glycosyl hydrolases family 38 C-terminal domain-containing protein [Arenibacter troitsensis]